jgi:hypothetical protein
MNSAQYPNHSPPCPWSRWPAVAQSPADELVIPLLAAFGTVRAQIVDLATELDDGLTGGAVVAIMWASMEEARHRKFPEKAQTGIRSEKCRTAEHRQVSRKPDSAKT